MSAHESQASAAESQAPRLFGLLAEFHSPDALLRAAERVRDAGYKRWDSHTPHPVHGLDDAMGVRPTILPWLALGGGVTGLAVALGLQWFTNAFNYPFIISGKPFFSLPANIPVMFELTVLFTAVGVFAWMLALNGLPRWHHPVFASERFQRATTDRYFIVIEARDPKFNEQETRELLESSGAVAVETLED